MKITELVDDGKRTTSVIFILYITFGHCRKNNPTLWDILVGLPGYKAMFSISMLKFHTIFCTCLWCDEEYLLHLLA